MQITLIENRERWNSAVLALGGTLYHSWEWGETRARLGWRPWHVLAIKDGSICAAVQIFERRVPFLRASLLGATAGIAGRDDEAGIVNPLATWLREFTAQRKAILLRMETSFQSTDELRKALLTSAGFLQLPDQWSLWNRPRATMVIDIRGSEEELLRHMRKKHREHIHRPQRNSVKIVASRETADLRAFYELLLMSSERQGFAVRDFNYFLHLREQLFDKDRGLLFLAQKDGRAVAGILCAQFSFSCHYLYGGFDWTARQAYANEALHWNAIQWAKKLGCTEYDMLGAGTSYPPIEGNNGHGVYNFKKGFGAALIYTAGYFDLINRPALYSAFRFAETHTGWMTPVRKIRSAIQQIVDTAHHWTSRPANLPNRHVHVRDAADTSDRIGTN